MKRYYYDANLTGKCLVYVEAKTRREADSKLENGDWVCDEDSVETECDFDYGSKGELPFTHSEKIE